jgi:hypothetical protein
VRTMVSTRLRHSAKAIDAAELHTKGCEHLADMVVELTREVGAFRLLRGDQLLRELPHVPLGFFSGRALLVRLALQSAEPDHRCHRDSNTQQEAEGQQGG